MQISASSSLPIPSSQTLAGSVTRPSQQAGTTSDASARTPPGSSSGAIESPSPGVAARQSDSVRQVERVSVQKPVRSPAGDQGGAEGNLLSALLEQMGGGGASTRGQIIDTFV